MKEDLQKLYNIRFSDAQRAGNDGIWIEICRYIERRFQAGRGSGIVVDVGAGCCSFINHYHCAPPSQKFAVDANPDVEKFAAGGVRAICGEIEQLPEYFKENSVSLFFMSNFLEHITKGQIRRLLQTEYRLLRPGGKVMILTPNIRYAGGKYWDFFDHITPITEKCLAEAAQAAGFQMETCIKKFLPYTTKSRLPKARWIVRCYLRLMPLSGRLFGGQSLLVLKK